MAFSEYLQQGIGARFRFKQLPGQGVDQQKQLPCDVFAILFGENNRSCVCSGVSRKPTGVADDPHVLAKVERKNLFVERVVRLEVGNIRTGRVNDTFKANSGEDTSCPGRNRQNFLRLNEKFSRIFGHSLWRLVFNSKRKHHRVVFPKVNLSAFRTYGQRVFVILEEVKKICRVDVPWSECLAIVNGPFNGSFFNALGYREGF